MRKKLLMRGLTGVLSLALATGLMFPANGRLLKVHAEAAAQGIHLTTDFLAPTDGTWDKENDQMVYYGAFGGEDTAFRVLEVKDGQLYLDSDEPLFEDVLNSSSFFPKFGQKSGWPSEFKGSTLYTELYGDKYYTKEGNLSVAEKKAIAEVSYPASTEDYPGVNAGGAWKYKDFAASGVKISLLSMKEALTLYASDQDRIKSGSRLNKKRLWWTRSSAIDGKANAGYINGSGTDSYQYVDYPFGVAPAFHVNQKNVLLVSNPAVQKNGQVAGITAGNTDKWKLTLLDAKKRVALKEGENATITSGTVTVPFTFSGKGIEQISVMVTDRDISETGAQVLAYGKLDTSADLTAESGEGVGTFTMPPVGDHYKVYIAAEDLTEGNRSDTASAFADLGTIEKGITTLTSVEMTGLELPVAEEALDRVVEVRTEGIDPDSVKVEWEKKVGDNQYEPAEGNAAFNTKYRAVISFKAAESFELNNDTTLAVDGKPAKFLSYDEQNQEIRYEVEAETPKAELLEVTPAETVEVPHGTPVDAIELPGVLKIMTQGNLYTEAPVIWFLEQMKESYDPEKKEAQNFTVKGKLELPEDIDAANVSLETTVDVHVDAAAKFALHVVHGSGAQEYYAKDAVVVKADAPKDGEKFKEWKIEGVVDLTDGTTLNSEEIHFLMPESEVTCEAVYEKVKKDEPKHDEPKHDEPKHDEPKHDEPKHDEPKHDEPKHDEPKHDEPKHDEPKHDEPKHDEPKHDEPKHVEPKHDEPKHDEPKHDEPKHGEPKHDEPKHDEPKHDEPKHNEPKHGEPKHDDVKTVEYKILKGANQVVMVGEEKEISIEVNADVKKFVSVSVDGQELKLNKDYTIHDGSTIVQFVKDYVAKLEAGKHEVNIKFSDGEVKTDLTVKENGTVKAGADKEMPTTGAGASMFGLTGLLSAVGIALFRKKEQD